MHRCPACAQHRGHRVTRPRRRLQSNLLASSKLYRLPATSNICTGAAVLVLQEHLHNALDGVGEGGHGFGAEDQAVDHPHGDALQRAIELHQVETGEDAYGGCSVRRGEI